SLNLVKGFLFSSSFPDQQIVLSNLFRHLLARLKDPETSSGRRRLGGFYFLRCAFSLNLVKGFLF
ncbi:MAG TPA: hypothetical protein VD908_10185, partial [Cytophagales bacterium]|nr:hypothetical protein [Cytophagales bacterium]